MNKKECQIKSPCFRFDCDRTPGHPGPCFHFTQLPDGRRQKNLWRQAGKGSIVWYVEEVIYPPLENLSNEAVAPVIASPAR